MEQTRSRYTAAETDWISCRDKIALRPLRPEGAELLPQGWGTELPAWLPVPDSDGLQVNFLLRSAPKDENVTDLCLRFRAGEQRQAEPEEPWLRPALGRKAVYGGVERLEGAKAVWTAGVRLTLRDGRKVLCRYTLRPHGLAGLWAGYNGGRLVTRPILCVGDCLLLNYATSAAGSIRVGILEGEGSEPVCGRSWEDCQVHYGNALSEAVRFRGSADLSPLRGRRIRLIFEMRDCVLCAFQFGNLETIERENGGPML